MSTRPEKPTLQTIADELGVSRATVSNAYNRPDQLSTALRERVLDVADRLGYSGPDAAARMLRTGHMGAIGLVFTEELGFVFSDPDTSAFMQGVAETSALSSTGLMLLPVPGAVEAGVGALRTVAVDGYVVFSVADAHPALDVVGGGDTPYVIVDEPDLGEGFAFVGINDRLGARLAADHLMHLGHRRVGILLGRVGLDGVAGRIDLEAALDSRLRVVRERMGGYLAGIREAEADEPIVWVSGAMDPDAGRRGATAMFEAHPEITAVLCFSDELAIGAAQAADRVNRRVPDDLSIVGFDDAPRARSWEPTLTTVRQPLVDKGRVAAELLLEQIAGGEPRRVELPIDLIVRDSTCSAR
ncbi:MAG: LacI family DNA-binding transcriptional regulator [Acidimicrobiales bacterium]